MGRMKLVRCGRNHSVADVNSAIQGLPFASLQRLVHTGKQISGCMSAGVCDQLYLLLLQYRFNLLKDIVYRFLLT